MKDVTPANRRQAIAAALTIVTGYSRLLRHHLRRRAANSQLTDYADALDDELQRLRWLLEALPSSAAADLPESEAVHIDDATVATEEWTTEAELIHTLKTRLTGARGYAQLLAREWQRPTLDPTRTSAHLDALLRELDRLTITTLTIEAVILPERRHHADLPAANRPHAGG